MDKLDSLSLSPPLSLSWCYVAAMLYISDSHFLVTAVFVFESYCKASMVNA